MIQMGTAKFGDVPPYDDKESWYLDTTYVNIGTRRVEFPKPFIKTPPNVMVALTGFILSGEYAAISIKPENITLTGFTLKIEKINETLLDGIEISWLAITY